jgi:two-component system sensor histidine kinase UhpB
MRKPPLLTQVLAVNTLLIGATVLTGAAAAGLAWGDERRQGLVLIAAVLATVLVNGLVLRRRFAPLERLIATMERVDLTSPGTRVGLARADSQEVERLHRAFDRMLDRLEEERHAGAAAVLRAQEAERARLARDLHDEANQALTAVLLRLQAAHHAAPPELVAELRETQAVATQAMQELLRLARELRPAALDDHGLEAALASMVDRFGREANVQASLVLDGEVDGLSGDEQLVVYRVVQESLSNVAQHARASRVDVLVRRWGARGFVRVRDDGCGFDRDGGTGGHGVRGMHERALLAGGRLDVRSVPGGGTTVELELRRLAPAKAAA